MCIISCEFAMFYAAVFMCKSELSTDSVIHEIREYLMYNVIIPSLGQIHFALQFFHYETYG